MNPIKLRQLRLSENLTQKDLASKLNISQAVITQYERFVHPAPTWLMNLLSEYFKQPKEIIITFDYVHQPTPPKDILRALQMAKTFETLDTHFFDKESLEYFGEVTIINWEFNKILRLTKVYETFPKSKDPYLDIFSNKFDSLWERHSFSARINLKGRPNG